MISIADPSDPRLAPYRALRERDLLGRESRFIAEGEVVLRVLLTASRFPVESILLSEKRARAMADLLAAVPAETPVYVAAQDIISGIVGFPMHRGVLALGRCTPPRATFDLLAELGPEAIVVGLVGIANHDNVGGIFRNAAAFGASAVLLDGTSCDPLYRKAIRVSVGAGLVVPFGRGGTAESLVEELGAAGFDIVALSPSGAEPLRSFRRSPRTALLLGAEGAGLPREILRRLNTARIPMAPGFDSLNVATASGIALHHLASAGQSGLALPLGRG
jgi:tRNA G18 (ribose-2'-O)-methylase SpoU